MTRKSFLAVLMIALFSLFSFNAFAIEEASPATAAGNAEHLKLAIEHAEAGYASAEAGDAAATAEHTKIALEHLKEINASDAIAAKLREGRKLLRAAWVTSKKASNKGESIGAEVREEIERAVVDLKGMQK